MRFRRGVRSEVVKVRIRRNVRIMCGMTQTPRPCTEISPRGWPRPCTPICLVSGHGRPCLSIAQGLASTSNSHGPDDPFHFHLLAPAAAKLNSQSSRLHDLPHLSMTVHLAGFCYRCDFCAGVSMSVLCFYRRLQRACISRWVCTFCRHLYICR